MHCPNPECGATVDEDARVCPQCGMELKPYVPGGLGEGDNLGTEALAQAARSRRIRKLANASVILAVLSCSLAWAAGPVLNVLGLQGQWRPPFVARLIPLSYVPLYSAVITALFMALVAIVAGHLAITKGGGTRRRLFAALLGYLAVALIILLAAWVILSRPLFVLRHCPLIALFLPRDIPQSVHFVYMFAVLALFPALGAFIFVHLAITRCRRVPRTGGVMWRPVLGALLGYFNIALFALFALALFSKWRPNMDMGVCQGNLKLLRVALEIYAKENEGMYPPLSSQPGVLMFSAEAIPPKISGVPLPLTCPTIRYAEKGTAGHKAAHMQTPPHDDQSYFYLGYAVLDDDDVEAFAKAYRKQIAEGGTFDEDLVVKDDEGTHIIHRLSEDVRRATLDHYSAPPYHSPGAAPADVPLLIERDRGPATDVPFLIERDRGHVYTDWDGPPCGANVLYFNSGVRFVKRGTWPLTEKTQRILAELAE